MYCDICVGGEIYGVFLFIGLIVGCFMVEDFDVVDVFVVMVGIVW